MRVKISLIGAERAGAALRKVAGRRAQANRGVEAAVVAVKYQRFRVVGAATGVGIKMGAPVRRPLSAIPLIETITMVTMGNTMLPMMININVIEADVIVVIMVAPAPSVWTPPGSSPGSEPESVAESEAEAYVPITGKARAESIRAWAADPVASDIRRVVPARAVNHDVFRTDLSAKVTRC